MSLNPTYTESETDGLVRRNYQASNTVLDLVDTLLYEEDGQYFHTVDGRFARVWQLQGFDWSVMTRPQLQAVSDALQVVLNEFPQESDGQIIRYSHRGVQGIINMFASEQTEHPFGRDIIDSIRHRQLSAISSSDGFFSNITPAMMKKAESAEVAQLDQEQRGPATIAIRESSREGRYPLMNEIYIAFIWTPGWQNRMKLAYYIRAMSSAFGLIEPNNVAKPMYDAAKKEFIGYADNIQRLLASQNFSPSLVTGQGMVDLLYRFLNPIRSHQTPSPIYRRDRTVGEMLADPYEIQSDTIARKSAFTPVKPNGTGMDFLYRREDGTETNYYYRVTSMMSCPGNTMAGMLQDALVPLEGESLTTINFNITAQRTINRRLWTRSKILDVKKQVVSPENEVFKQQLADYDYVKTAVSPENITSRQALLDTSVHVVFGGFDKTLVETRAKQAERLLFNVGYQELIRGDAIIHHAMPLNYRNAARGFLFRDSPYMSKNVADMAPLYLDYQGVATPAILVNNRSGEPIYIDLFGPQVRTAHSLVVGSTGTGKSFAFNNILMVLQAKYRPKVWLIDKGRSYESLCYALDGSYVDLVTEESADGVKPTCINPFFVPLNDDGSGRQPTKSEKEFLQKLLISMRKAASPEAQLSPAKSNLLFEAIDTFYQQWPAHQEATFSDFIPVLESLNYEEASGKSLAEELRLFYGRGPYAALVDGKIEVDWEADLIVLETERMSDSPALPVVMLALFRQIELYVKWKLPASRKKIIGVDEAWATLSDPTAADALGGFFRELRKYQAGVFLISQSVVDFVKLVNSENASGGGGKDGILVNTNHFFLLSCSQSDYKAAVEHLGFTQAEINAWSRVASLPPFFSEIFYRQRLNSDRYYSGVFRLYSAPVPLWIATSDPIDKTRRKNLIEEKLKAGVDPSEARRQAIRELAEQYPYGSRYEVKDAA